MCVSKLSRWKLFDIMCQNSYSLHHNVTREACMRKYNKKNYENQNNFSSVFFVISLFSLSITFFIVKRTTDVRWVSKVQFCMKIEIQTFCSACHKVELQKCQILFFCNFLDEKERVWFIIVKNCFLQWIMDQSRNWRLQCWCNELVKIWKVKDAT